MLNDKPQTTSSHVRKGRRRRRGAGLFDSMLTMFIVILAIGGLVALYLNISAGMKNNETRMLVMRTIATIESAYRSQSSYTNGSLLPVLETSGNFEDSEVWESGGTFFMRSPFDTEMTVAGDGARDFTITVAELSKDACAALLEGMMERDRDMDGLTVNGVAVAIPYDSVAVSTACRGNAADEYDVALTF